MDAATLLPLALKASIFLIVCSFGLRAGVEDVTYLLRRPGELARSLLAMNVVMPLLAVGMALALELHPAVELALVTLSVSPVPPVLPRRQLKAGGHHSYALGLLVTAAVLAIGFIPVTVALLGRAFSAPAEMPAPLVARLVLATILAPLAAGMLFRRVAPALAERAARPAAGIGALLLTVGAGVILFGAWRAVHSLLGNGSVLAFMAFVAAGLAAGHLLGDRAPGHRPVLALATASRHPGIALAIAHANFPGQKLAAAAILLYLLVSAVLSTLYLAWDRRRTARAAAASESPEAGLNRSA